MFYLPIETIAEWTELANRGHIGAQEALADIEIPGWDCIDDENPRI